MPDLKNSKNDPNRHDGGDAIESHVDGFIAEVKAAGYAPCSVCTKRAALRRFLLWRRGLRSCEVLALELGDIRWRTGEILIRGKGGRRDPLPLPQDVGAALARYLHLDRDVRPAQRVFLRANAPRLPLSGPANIGHIVRRAMAQAAVDLPKQIAAHLFRHSRASRRLQQGASLSDISEVLRHRSPGTTEIYAKIDMRSLNEVVRPWPAKGGLP